MQNCKPSHHSDVDIFPGDSAFRMYNRSTHGWLHLGQHAPRWEGHRCDRLHKDPGGRQDKQVSRVPGPQQVRFSLSHRGNLFCRKDTLWQNFRHMQKKFGKAFDFHPDTFQVKQTLIKKNPGRYLEVICSISERFKIFQSVLESFRSFGVRLGCQEYYDKSLTRVKILQWLKSWYQATFQLPAEHDQLVKRMEEEKCTKVSFSFFLCFLKILSKCSNWKVYIVKLPNNMCGIGACVIDSPSKVIPTALI